MERKLIIAVLRPFLLDKIVVALEDIEKFPGITVTDAEGFRHRLRNTLDDALDPFHPKKQIEISAPLEMVEEIVETIRKHAHGQKRRRDNLGFANRANHRHLIEAIEGLI